MSARTEFAGANDNLAHLPTEYPADDAQQTGLSWGKRPTVPVNLTTKKEMKKEYINKGDVRNNTCNV